MLHVFNLQIFAVYGQNISADQTYSVFSWFLCYSPTEYIRHYITVDKPFARGNYLSVLLT